jgi:uncharacterized protein
VRYPGLLLLSLLLPLGASASSGLDGAERVTLFSKVLGEERVLGVVTPASYGRSQERYPVLYLTDAEVHLGHARATVEFLARNGLMPEMVLVGIFNTARTRDLTPTAGTQAEHTAFPSAGGGERFLDFIAEELIPAIDARYRTVPTRLYAGHSFGGLLGVHAVLTRPGLFRAVVAASPSLVWDGALMAREARALENGLPRTARALFVTVGGKEAPPPVLEDYQDFARAMRDVARPGFDWSWSVIPDEDHGSVVLSAYYAGLRHLFSGWRMPLEEPSAPPPTLRNVQVHYANLSERWGYPIAPPEGVVNLQGYRALQHGAEPEAIELFRFNVAAHPDSPNVYDSLGEALERNAQPSAARESYRKAVELGESAGDSQLPSFRAHLEKLDRRALAPASSATPW